MKLKRYIAFVLCTLYIAATAGMALASLTCKCLAMRSGTVEHLCLACRCEMAGGLPAADCGCAAGGDDTRLYARSGETPDAEEDAGIGLTDAGNGLLSGGCDCRLGTGCDCDRHSTEIELYTSSHSDDNEKAVRCIVAELPPSLAAEFGPGVSLTIHQGISFIVSDPLPLEGVVAVVGRRAPPFRA